MGDNSNFVLSWEIDNAKATLATGRAESGVFNEGGFKWVAAIEKYLDKDKMKAKFILHCDAGSNVEWSCETQIGVYLLDARGNIVNVSENHVIYNESNSVLSTQSDTDWPSLLSNVIYRVKDKITIQYRINIISSDRGPIADPTMLYAPNRRSDVILKIGEKKLHLSKELLALHSPVFETLFFGDFAENGKEEVEIKDVVYEEFLDILHLIYSRTSKITDRTVLHILKIADQFQMENILDESKKHLTQSKGFDVVKKLQIADQYHNIPLRDHCLLSFTSDTELKQKLKSSPEFDNFSDGMKVAICNRIVRL